MRKKTKPELTWQRLGVCAMDTAGLLIADPCYVIHQDGRDPATLEVNDYAAWVSCKDEVLRLKFKRGHEGAGLIVHSPNGDGSVTVYGEVDAHGNIRGVYFSFDGKQPATDAKLTATLAALNAVKTDIADFYDQNEDMKDAFCGTLATVNAAITKATT